MHGQRTKEKGPTAQMTLKKKTNNGITPRRPPQTPTLRHMKIIRLTERLKRSENMRNEGTISSRAHEEWTKKDIVKKWGRVKREMQQFES